jgi:leucyl aminopeptidase
MKSDMAGAAAVIGTIYAAAKMNLPVYLIGLVPSTDNAISERSYAPGEVLTMHNGMTVEINNTDAEGRLILADALSYAQKYEPQLVIDLATLTGSAMRAVGPYASAMFAKTEEDVAQKLLGAGFEVYERLVQFPLWDEYDEMLKSDIADLKNVGGSNAGLITAAKFLEHFTDYPWIHLDIAPNAYLDDNKVYFGKGATGIGVRLLIRFLQKM